MRLSNGNGLGYEFDGKLEFSSGTSALIECMVAPPAVGGRKAVIDLRVPSTSMPVLRPENPCTLESIDATSGTKIYLDEVWFRSITSEFVPRRLAGSSPILLTHVGKLKIVREKPDTSTAGVHSDRKSTIRFLLNDNEFLGQKSLMMSIWNKLGEFEDQLYQIDIPDLGTVRFVREWSKTTAMDKNDVIVRSGFAAVLDIEEASVSRIDDIVAKFEDALFVISILWRQRVFMVGWCLDCRDRTEEMWKNPLDPLITKFVPEHERDFLVDQNFFEVIANAALKAYFDLPPELKSIFKDFSVGVSPFLDLSTSQQFMSLFQSLEGCAGLSKGQLLTAEEEAANKALQLALESAKVGVDAATSARIDGLIKSIHRPSLQQKLNLVLSSWSINQYDLWPLFGTEALPGLKNIRDKLAHSGSMGVYHQSLDVANRHFCILVERILISFLKLSLEQTNAKDNSYSRFRHDTDDEILNLRKRAFKAKN